MPQSDRMSGAIIVHHDWMVDRNIGCSLLEIRDGISAHGHDVRHELVRPRYRKSRIINKLSLQLPPGIRKTFLITLRYWAYLETFDPLFALFENLLCLTPVASLRHGPLI